MLFKDERGKLLEHLFSEKTQLPLKVDLDQFAMKTEGFVVQDVVDFVNRSVFESYKEGRYLQGAIIVAMVRRDFFKMVFFFKDSCSTVFDMQVWMRENYNE